ncbi:MAG: hypothetical protein U1A77_18530 [Pirellulales bacterium]
MPTTDSETLFRESDEIVDDGYRRTTPWAIVTLLLGLAASLALITPVLWGLPLFALGCGAIALRSIRQNSETVTGERWTQVGMGLAAFFLAWGVATYYVQSQMSYAHAQIFAAQWFELIKEGKLREAHQLRRSHFERADPTVNLEEYYNRAENREMYETFKSEPVVARLIRMGADARLTYVGNVAFLKEGAALYLVAVQFRIDSATNKEPSELVNIEMSREYFGATKESRWAVRTIVPVAAK